MNLHPRLLLGLAILAAGSVRPAAADQVTPVGVARIDITPDYPIRLTGYATRKTESEGVAGRLWAKALAIGGDEGEGPAVLMMVENCGVPGTLTAEVAGRLKAKAGLKPERFVVCSTHTHSGPLLDGFAPAIFSDLPPEHRAQHRAVWTRAGGADGKSGLGGAGGPQAGTIGLGPRRSGFRDEPPADRQDWPLPRAGRQSQGSRGPQPAGVVRHRRAGKAPGDRGQLRLPRDDARRRLQSHPWRLAGRGPGVHRGRPPGHDGLDLPRLCGRRQSRAAGQAGNGRSARPRGGR